MRIMIGLHHLVLGGDTINALELAERLQRRGHSAIPFAFHDAAGGAPEPPLLSLAAERGVRVVAFPSGKGVLGRIRMVRALARFARDERIDVVHTFGHQDTYYAIAGTYGVAGVPLVVNDYNMSLTAGLPRRVPLVVGTEDMLDEARRLRPGPAFLIEPPVDAEANRPGVVDGDAFRASVGCGPGDVLVVMVSRLSRSMKAEGLRAAIDAVVVLDDPRVRLALVGDGGAVPELTSLAAAANARLGRAAVVLTGAMVDPRPAYEAADIVVGMGHSGLRAMAFGKPLVVVGERGFSMPLTLDTLDHVRHQGVYGLGDGQDMAPGLAEHLRPLIDDHGLRAERGRLAREYVVDRYSLESAVDRLEQVYRKAAGSRSALSWARDIGYIARTYVPGKLRRALVRA